MAHPKSAGRWPRAAGVRTLAAGMVLGTLVMGSSGGCTLLGGMIESYRQQSTRPVEAKYDGIQGKSVAVVVIAERSIEADFPGVTATLIDRINSNIIKEGKPSFGMSSVELVQYLMNNPQLLAKPRGELAAHLGVERLIVVELREFRLNDPGNQYLWEGVAAGQVSVVEADGPLPDDYAFTEQVRVRFPDESGVGPDQYGRDVVSAALLRRFVDRASWLFYVHEEPYYPKY